MKQRHVQLFNSILLTIYLVGSVPFYLTEGSSLEGHVIAEALFFYLIIFHELFILGAVLFQWIGYMTKSRGWIRLANLTMFIGGIVGILLVVPIFVIIPIILINMISKTPKKILKTDS